MSDLVGIPEDWLSHVAAHGVLYNGWNLNAYSWTVQLILKLSYTEEYPLCNLGPVVQN